MLFVIRQAGHQDLADRLVEIQYELTDRLAFYLCGRKPGESVRWRCVIMMRTDILISSCRAGYADEAILQHAFTWVRSDYGLESARCLNKIPQWCYSQFDVFNALVCIFISGLPIVNDKPWQYVSTVNTFCVSDHKNGQHFIIPQMADR